MKIRAPRATPLRPVYPSAAMGAQYDKALTDAVDAMDSDVRERLSDRYTVTMDATPASLMRSAFRRVQRRWLKKFDDLAPRLAQHFARGTQQAVDTSLKSMLRDAGFTVKFSMTPAQRNALEAVIGEQVALIRSIASQYLSAVEGAVMRSVGTGRDLAGLSDELEKTYGITRRRAVNIARSQNNMATSILCRARCAELGLTEAKWLHSHGGKEPRPSHIAFSGKTFDVAKGAWLDEKWTWPGMEPGCKCVYVPIVPGFDD